MNIRLLVMIMENRMHWGMDGMLIPKRVLRLSLERAIPVLILLHNLIDWIYSLLQFLETF